MPGRGGRAWAFSGFLSCATGSSGQVAMTTAGINSLPCPSSYPSLSPCPHQCSKSRKDACGDHLVPSPSPTARTGSLRHADPRGASGPEREQEQGIPGSPFSPADPGIPSLPGSPFWPAGPVGPGFPGRPKREESHQSVRHRCSHGTGSAHKMLVPDIPSGSHYPQHSWCPRGMYINPEECTWADTQTDSRTNWT